MGLNLLPGSIAHWMGNELFTSHHMSMRNVVSCSRGGIALLVSIVKKERDGYFERLAYIVINGQVGWAPTNWLDNIA